MTARPDINFPVHYCGDDATIRDSKDKPLCDLNFTWLTVLEQQVMGEWLAAALNFANRAAVFLKALEHINGGPVACVEWIEVQKDRLETFG